ncbi:MAG: vWA domain-containing protein, partial [Pseudomonadota bacterium]
DIDGDFGPMFLDEVGVPTLPLVAMSEATEAINDVEVSLVLDVSGSMGWNSKLSRMQGAANDFVTQILQGAEDGRVSVSVVPYSTQVSVGPRLMSMMNTHHNHNLSHCVNFPGNSFNQTDINPGVSLPQTAHFDPWKGWNQSRDPENFVCRTESYMDILPWQNDVTTLTNRINALEAAGNTSIDVAVKWGAALLDPSLQTQLTSMQVTGEVPPEFVQRPFAFDRPDTLKFIVVMTDGINTQQYYLRNQFKTGNSPIWLYDEDNTSNDPNDIYFSSFDPEPGDLDGDGDSGEEYWAPHDRSFRDQPFHDQPSGYEGPVDLEDDETLRQLSWQEVWQTMSLSWRSYEFFYEQERNANHYYRNYYQGGDAPMTWVNASTKDNRLDQICSAAKDQNVVIFAIGFEVTDASAQVMRDCASTPSHFYRVEGLDIEFAFASIANKINQLKLTQ